MHVCSRQDVYFSLKSSNFRRPLLITNFFYPTASMVTSAGTSSSNQLVDDKFLRKASAGFEDTDATNKNGHEKSPRPDRTEQDMLEMEQCTTPPPLIRGRYGN